MKINFLSLIPLFFAANLASAQGINLFPGQSVMCGATKVACVGQQETQTTCTCDVWPSRKGADLIIRYPNGTVLTKRFCTEATNNCYDGTADVVIINSDPQSACTNARFLAPCEG